MKKLLCNILPPNLQKKMLYWAGLFCTALLLLCFFTLHLNLESFWILDFHTPNSFVLYTFCFMGLCWLLHKISGFYLHYKNGFWQTLLQGLFSFFFAVISVLGIYFDTGSPFPLSRVLSHISSLAFFLIALFGGTLFFFLLIRFIWNLQENKPEDTRLKSNYLSLFFEEHLYRNCVLLLLVFWLPQYIIRFPGAVPYDTWQSLAMVLGYTEMTTQHPMLWNLIFGSLTQLGTTIGIPWLAPLVICLVHFVLALLLIPYVISSLKKLGVKHSFLMSALLFFALIPQLKLYLSTAYNDFVFCLAFLLLTIEFTYYLYDRACYFTGCRHILLTALATLATMFRYNGFYTMLVVIGVVLIRELVLLWKRNARVIHTVLLSSALILPLLGGQILQGTLNRAYDARSITNRAMLALPIQQSVRCLIVHGKQIPQEDYQALHAVLTWSDEEYAQAYNPRNFDSVKESFRTDASDQELASFVKAWTNLVRRYPVTCFMATANQTYYLFSPLANNVRYYDTGAHNEFTMERYNFDATPYMFSFPPLKLLGRGVSFLHNSVLPNLPILGLLVSQGIYTLLLFVIFLRTLFSKDKRILLLTVALLITLGITFIGPAVYKHPRYTFPLVYCMPVLLGIFLKRNTLKEVQE